MDRATDLAIVVVIIVVVVDVVNVVVVVNVYVVCVCVFDGVVNIMHVVNDDNIVDNIVIINISNTNYIWRCVCECRICCSCI